MNCSVLYMHMVGIQEIKISFYRLTSDKGFKVIVTKEKKKGVFLVKVDGIYG